MSAPRHEDVAPAERRRPRAARLKLGNYNPGGALSRVELIDDVVRLMSRYDLDGLALEEFAKRGPVLADICRELPWVGVWAGDGTRGANATPILWDSRRWNATDRSTVPLTPATRLPQPKGPRDPAGPQTVKRKPLNVVTLIAVDAEHRPEFEVDGYPIMFRLGPLHAPASHWWPPRRRLAREQLVALDRWAAKHDDVPLFVPGDFNTPPTGRAREVLRARGWVSAQQHRPGGPAITHPKTGGRIDDVEHYPAAKQPHRPRRVWIPTGVQTLHTMHGDHLPTITRWRLSEPR